MTVLVLKRHRKEDGKLPAPYVCDFGSSGGNDTLII
jgi:hypothetical protein